MINVRRMANTLTSMVNPNINAVLRVNDGYTVDDWGNQIPSYSEHTISLQAQSLESKERFDLGLVEHQGEFIIAYAYGSITAIKRWKDSGSSQLVFTPYGESEPVTWNVHRVLESYSTWVRVLLARIS